MILAAAAASDIIVLIAAAVGALLAIAGLASFDPRVRTRLPVGVLARGNTLASVGLIVLGLMVVAIALGGGD